MPCDFDWSTMVIIMLTTVLMIVITTSCSSRGNLLVSYVGVRYFFMAESQLQPLHMPNSKQLGQYEDIGSLHRRMSLPGCPAHECTECWFRRCFFPVTYHGHLGYTVDPDFSHKRRPELQIPAQLYVLLSGDLVSKHLKFHSPMENYHCDLCTWETRKTWGKRSRVGQRSQLSGEKSSTNPTQLHR